MDVETTLVIPIIAMGTIRDAIMDKFVAIKVRPMVLLLSVNKLTMVGSAIAKAIAVPLLLLPLPWFVWRYAPVRREVVPALRFPFFREREQNVGWFEIVVNDSKRMQVSHASCDLK